MPGGDEPKPPPLKVSSLKVDIDPQPQLNDLDPLNPERSISTREFLQWETAAAKREHTKIIQLIAVVLVFVTLMALFTLFNVQYQQKTTKIQLQNQADIASLRAVRTQAVTENEVALCKSVYDIIQRQRDVIVILQKDSPLVHGKTPSSASNELIAQRNAQVLALYKQVVNVGLPACDGFPAGPLPSER